MGMTIKLLARMVKADGSYCCRVAPYLLNPDHPLFSVNGVFNAVFVKGNMLGDSMYYGSGAGKLPTASAVTADLVSMALNIDRDVTIGWSEEKLSISDPMNQENRYFVRARVGIGDISRSFPDAKIIDAGYDNETAFVTGKIREGAFKEIMNSLGEPVSVIRLA